MVLKTCSKCIHKSLSLVKSFYSAAVADAAGAQTEDGRWPSSRAPGRRTIIEYAICQKIMYFDSSSDF